MSEIVVLDRSTCLELLATVEMGRVAWADGSGRVIVEPVNFTVDGESVVFRTAEGSKVEAVRQGRPLSFEADDVEPALRVGWSVLVTGAAEIVDVARDERLRSLAVRPWDESAPKPYFIRIHADEATGRRIPVHPGGRHVHRRQARIGPDRTSRGSPH
jgi:nitroimidazol reductase NimA-like FMN-containing flavoprotein (pyridoxamine 5'-phosphate oxidase superfamily)